jgi:hypothetical protein
MKTVQAYMTSDGQIFPSTDAAEKHELFLDKKETIGEFLDSDLNLYRSGTQRIISKNAIVNWELWKAKNVK